MNIKEITIDFNESDLNQEIINKIDDMNKVSFREPLVVGLVNISYECSGDSQDIKGILIDRNFEEAMERLGYVVETYSSIIRIWKEDSNCVIYYDNVITLPYYDRVYNRRYLINIVDFNNSGVVKK